MKGIFLLGTDTGVGKTTLACGLLHLARQRAFPLVPYKPVETGCDPLPQDALRLIQSTGSSRLTVSDVCPYALRTPVAPSVAARLDGKTIDPNLLVIRATSLVGPHGFLLAEGAGGLLTPYGPGLDGATLAGLLDLEVVLVAANRLGTINHTLLALEAIRSRGLRCAGIVLVDVIPPTAPDSETNLSEIATVGRQKTLGRLRFLPDRSPRATALAIGSDLDLSPILSGALRRTA
jgi:dethiobiotin synthetase